MSHRFQQETRHYAFLALSSHMIEWDPPNDVISLLLLKAEPGPDFLVSRLFVNGQNTTYVVETVAEYTLQ